MSGTENHFLPEDVSDPDQLDEVIQTINDLGLQVVENAPEEGSEAMEAISQPVAPEPTENEMGAIESEVGRTTDPVRLYMRDCLLYTSPSPRDRQKSRMPSSA